MLTSFQSECRAHFPPLLIDMGIKKIYNTVDQRNLKGNPREDPGPKTKSVSRATQERPFKNQHGELREQNQGAHSHITKYRNIFAQF